MRKVSANDDVMTTREAGEVLGVAVRTVQLWVESGVLPAWRTAGGHRRVSREAVERLLEQRQDKLTSPVAAPAEAAQRSLKLLLVEDDANVRQLFSDVVASWTLPVELSLATNGFDGLVHIGEKRPDLVVLDLLMPGMDGFEMLRALKKPDSSFAGLQVLVVSALSDEEIAERGGLPEGVTNLQKPLHFGHLHDLARQCYEGLQSAASV